MDWLHEEARKELREAIRSALEAGARHAAGEILEERKVSKEDQDSFYEASWMVPDSTVDAVMSVVEPLLKVLSVPKAECQVESFLTKIRDEDEAFEAEVLRRLRQSGAKDE